jgi:carbamate kinase
MHCYSYCEVESLVINYNSPGVYPINGVSNPKLTSYLSRYQVTRDNMMPMCLAANRNLIQEEIKGRLNSGNACYHSVQNLLSSRLLSKNIQLEYTKL